MKDIDGDTNGTNESRNSFDGEYERFRKHYGWYSSLCDMADGDIRAMDTITSYTTSKVLYFLEYRILEQKLNKHK